MSGILKIKRIKADTIGIISGSLCLVHCIATPFIFIAKACTATCCSATPVWWKWIDYLFIVISFIAIYHATKYSAKQWVKIALWASWALLLFTIVNESLTMVPLPESFIYLPSLSIVGLHIYNLKYCQCQEGDTCAN